MGEQGKRKKKDRSKREEQGRWKGEKKDKTNEKDRKQMCKKDEGKREKGRNVGDKGRKEFSRGSFLDARRKDFLMQNVFYFSFSCISINVYEYYGNGTQVTQFYFMTPKEYLILLIFFFFFRYQTNLFFSKKIRPSSFALYIKRISNGNMVNKKLSKLGKEKKGRRRESTIL